jgi:hypothetical protein
MSDGSLVCAPSAVAVPLFPMQVLDATAMPAGLLVSERLSARAAAGLSGDAASGSEGARLTAHRDEASAFCAVLGPSLDGASVPVFRLPTAWERYQLCRADLACLETVWADTDAEEAVVGRSIVCVADVEPSGPVAELWLTASERAAAARAAWNSGAGTGEPSEGDWPARWGRGWAFSTPLSPLHWTTIGARLVLEACSGDTFSSETQVCACFDGVSLRPDCARDANGLCDCAYR